MQSITIYAIVQSRAGAAKQMVLGHGAQVCAYVFTNQNLLLLYGYYISCI